MLMASLWVRMMAVRGSKEVRREGDLGFRFWVLSYTFYVLVFGFWICTRLGCHRLGSRLTTDQLAVDLQRLRGDFVPGETVGDQRFRSLSAG